GRHLDGDAEPDRNHHQGHRPPEARPGMREDPRHPSAGTVQGQGRALRWGADHPEGGHEEVIIRHSHMQITKKKPRQHRASKARTKIGGLGGARLTIPRTPQRMYAQVFDASGGKVLASASTVQEKVAKGLKGTGNVEAAKAVGTAIAEAAKAAGITK